MSIIKSTFSNKKEEFNAMSNSDPLEKYVDQELTFVNYVMYTKPDKDTDEERQVVAFKTVDGDYIGSISSNIMDQTNMVTSVFGDITPENPLTAVIEKKKSKQGRDFLSMRL